MTGPATRVSLALKQIAADLDKALEQAAGERVAFTLVVFTPGRANYISSADRADSVTQLRHLLDQWDHGLPDIPAHKVS